MKPQKTLKKSVVFKGKGLHFGKEARLVLRPAEPNTGIRFIVKHEGREAEIEATYKNYMPMPFCTALSGQGLYVRSTEHLLAALYCTEVTNVVIELYGNEVPLLDGSAEVFIQDIDRAGVIEQAAVAPILKIIKPIRHEWHLGYTELTPYDGLALDMTIQVSKTQQQRWMGAATPENIRRECATARTFGPMLLGLLAKTVYRFAKYPIALGANYNNALMLIGAQAFCRGGLRHDDECVRHRVLDFMGDLLLCGFHIEGKMTTFRPSHHMNYNVMKKIFDNPDAYKIIASRES